MSAKTYDVAIVGAGIIGGAIAWELVRAGLRVVLLDRQQAGMEASWAAAGMLAPGAETPDSVPVAPLGRASLALYPEFVAGIEMDSGARVEFEPGDALQVFFGEAAERESEAFLALHRELGMRGEVIAPDLARKLEPELSRQAAVAVLCEDEARVNGRALTAAVLEAAQKRGAELRAGTAVTQLGIAQGRVTGVLTASGAIAAGRVVIAAGCWSGELEQVAQYAPTRPVRGQMVAVRSELAPLRHVLRSHSGYVVPRADGRLVCGSTAEPEAGFEKGVTPEGQQRILAAAKEVVPALGHAVVVEKWSGLRPDTPDHLPSLGPTDVEGLLMATGHYRNGLLLAPITARLMREWVIEGRAVSFATEAFSPMRFAAA